MSAKGRSPYRGCSPLEIFLKILAAAAIALILLGVAAVIYLQQYLVISHDGVRLMLPFFQPDTLDSSVSPDSPDDPAVTPDAALAGSEAIHPVLLPQKALTDGTAARKVKAADGDCALFDMKTDSGMLSYTSTVELAVFAQRSADNPELNEAIRELNETPDLYTVARVSCFKDDEIPTYVRNLSLFTNDNSCWTDLSGTHWVSPANSIVRDYLTEICIELAELGFDEILLDNAGYPSEGDLSDIKKGSSYDAAQLSAVIDEFYAQITAALADYDCKLSVVATPEALDGTDALTGQTSDNLARFSRLWIRDATGTLFPAKLMLE